MIVNEKAVISGDFLSSYIYNDVLLLQMMDDKLYSINTRELDAKSSIDFDDYVNKKQKKCLKLDQFITDFDVYDNTIIYSNSSGLFQIKMSDVSADDVHPSKLWDAPVQCVRIGDNGRVALSLAREGLYEYDLGRIKLAIDNGVKKTDNKIRQISKSHSISCNWSHGNLWNYSNIGECSLFTFSRNDNFEDRLFFAGEYTSKNLFEEQKEKSYMYLSENKKLVNRLSKKSIETVRFSQSNNETVIKGTQKRKLHKQINIDDVRDIAEIRIKDELEPLIVYETRNGVTIIDSYGKIVHQIEDKTFVSWRVFPKSKTHRNELHVVFDDRLEIIKFYASTAPDSNNN